MEDATSFLGIPNSENFSSFFKIIGGDPCILSPIDILHNERLGLIMKEILNIYNLLDHGMQKKFIENLGKCTPPKYLEKVSPTIFEKPKNVSGKEWGCVMWNAPLALLGILSITSKQFQCITLHATYYRVLCQDRLTIEDIDRLDKLMHEHHKLYAEIYPEDFITITASGNQTASSFINFHLTKHWKFYIYLFGSPKYFSVESLEAKHKLLKELIRKCSNYKDLSYYIPISDYQNLFSNILQENIIENPKEKLHNRGKQLENQIVNGIEVPEAKMFYFFHSFNLKGQILRTGEHILFNSLPQFNIGKIISIIGTKEKKSPYFLIENLGVGPKFQPIPYYSILNIQKEKYYWVKPSEIQKKILLILNPLDGSTLFDLYINV